MYNMASKWEEAYRVSSSTYCYALLARDKVVIVFYSQDYFACLFQISVFLSLLTFPVLRSLDAIKVMEINTIITMSVALSFEIYCCLCVFIILQLASTCMNKEEISEFYSKQAGSLRAKGRYKDAERLAL